MGSIRSSLNRLEEALQAVGSPLVAHRPSPLDEAAVRDRIASLGLTAPQGLIDWYGWRNGDGGPIEPVQRIESSLFLGRAVAVTLDQASYMYGLLRDALRDTDTFGFEEGWLPILIGHSSSLAICIDCITQPGSIVLFDTQTQQPATPDSRVFPSVAELADLYVDAIERGWVNLDRSSPHFLDFVISRVPEDQWFPILSL